VATREMTMKIKIGRRALSSLPAVTRATIFYDTDLTGFGLKASPTGALSFVVEYRPGAGGRSVSKRRMVIGTPKNLTPEEARNLAAGLLARVRLGEDPAAERSNARKAETVSDLLTTFMDDHILAKRKARTAKLFQGYIDNHIEPALGTRKAPSLSRADVERLHKSIGKAKPVTANRVLALIGAAYSYGMRSGRLPERMTNPASGIENFESRFASGFFQNQSFIVLERLSGRQRRLGSPGSRKASQSTLEKWKIGSPILVHTPRRPCAY
jgi:Arm DNA-binding domain